MNLKDYIGEATAYDKKLMIERKDPTSWLKSVSAFANTQGGRLLFGVANDNSLVGLADAQSDADQVAGQVTDQVTDQVADQLTDALTEIADSLPVNAKRLLRILRTDMDFNEIMSKTHLSSRGHLRKTALNPALESGLVEMTQPDSPRSPTQKYRLTAKGREMLAYYSGIGTDGKSDGAMSTCTATTTKTTTKTTNNPTNKSAGKQSVIALTAEATTEADINKTGMKTGGTVNPPVNLSEDLPVNLPVNLTVTAKKIYNLLKEDGKYTYDRLANAVGVTRETVRVSIRSLVDANLIRRVGPDKGGHWEVVK